MQGFVNSFILRKTDNKSIRSTTIETSSLNMENKSKKKYISPSIIINIIEQNEMTSNLVGLEKGLKALYPKSICAQKESNIETEDLD